jgi:hypothetical protein
MVGESHGLKFAWLSGFNQNWILSTNAEFTHQQMHFYEFKEHIKIYMKKYT